VDEHDQDAGGSGGKERDETGVTALRGARLERLAIKRGWLKGQRWATDATVTDLMAIQQQRDLTLRERAVLAVMSDISGKDARIRQIAVKSAIIMEGQNQHDEMPDREAGTQVNVGVSVGVQVIESDDWYGTRAATNGHVTAGNGAPAAGALESVAVQGGGVRPAVGQNGHRTNGHAEGPREPPRPAAGGD
jgi:hypothetical protein